MFIVQSLCRAVGGAPTHTHISLRQIIVCVMSCDGEFGKWFKVREFELLCTPTITTYILLHSTTTLLFSGGSSELYATFNAGGTSLSSLSQSCVI